MSRRDSTGTLAMPNWKRSCLRSVPPGKKLSMRAIIVAEINAQKNPTTPSKIQLGDQVKLSLSNMSPIAMAAPTTY